MSLSVIDATASFGANTIGRPPTSICIRPTSSSRNTREKSDADRPVSAAVRFAQVRRIDPGTPLGTCNATYAVEVSLMWNKDEAKGKAEEVKGRAKQAVGDATDNEDLTAEGEIQEAGGKVQGGFGKARREVGNAIKDVGNAVKR